MALSMVHFLCVFLCISSLQSMVKGTTESLNITSYVHEIRGEPNVSTVLVAAGTGEGDFTKEGWGSFLVADNMVKEGESPDSKVLGQNTGTGAITTMGGIPLGGLQALDTFIFGEGSIYNGSSIVIMGTLSNPSTAPWEVIVLGGTGYFRGIKGYAIAQPATSTPPLFVTKYNFYLHR